MSTPTTQPLQADRDGRPVAQYWNPRTRAYEPAHGDVGAMQITSMQGKWREDFPGASLNAANWQTVQTGAGHTVTVAGSNLAIATNTTISTETIIRSLQSFTIPFRTMFIFMLSQRIINQEFFLEVLNTAGTMVGRWQFDGTSAVVGTHNTINEGTAGTPASPTITTTAAMAIAEIELFPDEVYFHSRPVDSTAVRTLSAVRTRFIPDPNQNYFIQIRARNLAVAPASNTTLTIDAITVQDIAELTAEITGGRGQIIGSQALAVQAVGGTIGTVSTVTTASTLTTMTTGNIQSINTAFADTAAALGANAIFNSTARDFTVTQRANRFRVASTADVAGTLFVEQSNDGTNWVLTHSQATAGVADADGAARHIAVIDAPVVNRFARVRYRNGATLQAAFRLISMQTGV